MNPEICRLTIEQAVYTGIALGGFFAGIVLLVGSAIAAVVILCNWAES
jgi:hypothetical protein